MTPRQMEIRSKKAEDILGELKASVRQIAKKFCLIENLRRSYIIEEDETEKDELLNKSNEAVSAFYNLVYELGENLTKYAGCDNQGG